MNYLRRCVCLVFLVGVMVGCDVVAPVYSPSTGGYLGANITPKDTWAARGDLANPAYAIDQDLSTAARSDYQYKGAELIIDLKKVCLFQTVIIEHGAAKGGHCRSVDISTSVDGKIFTNKYVAPGTRRVTIASLPAPTLARYVRLEASRPGRGRWAIAEIYIQ
ncbi:MAG: discoidin domain-containing protein [Phycisphaerae bacterium]|nr:discoidin domain-containing protein [Phycisphaerae bacterium]